MPSPLMSHVTGMGGSTLLASPKLSDIRVAVSAGTDGTNLTAVPFGHDIDTVWACRLPIERSSKRHHSILRTSDTDPESHIYVKPDACVIDGFFWYICMAWPPPPERYPCLSCSSL